MILQLTKIRVWFSIDTKDQFLQNTKVYSILQFDSDYYTKNFHFDYAMPKS